MWNLWIIAPKRLSKDSLTRILSIRLAMTSSCLVTMTDSTLNLSLGPEFERSEFNVNNPVLSGSHKGHLLTGSELQ